MSAQASGNVGHEWHGLTGAELRRLCYEKCGLNPAWMESRWDKLAEAIVLHVIGSLRPVVEHGHNWIADVGFSCCECGWKHSEAETGSKGFTCKEQWQAHLAFMQAEQAAKPVASSAHFPRITKHDLEVVVEAMDKLREALRAEEEAARENADESALPTLLEARIESLQARDRELVEKLEELAAKWDKCGCLNCRDKADELRAALAARNERGK